MKNSFLLFIIILLLTSCEQNTESLVSPEAEITAVEEEIVSKSEPVSKAEIRDEKVVIEINDKEEGKSNLPFIGKRYYNLRPLSTGTGTPQYFVEIKADGDVYFGYEAHYLNGTNEYEILNVGKYKQIVQCKSEEHATGSYFAIASDHIREVDRNGKIVLSLDCCEADLVDSCPCESELYGD